MGCALSSPSAGVETPSTNAELKPFEQHQKPQGEAAKKGTAPRSHEGKGAVDGLSPQKAEPSTKSQDAGGLTKRVSVPNEAHHNNAETGKGGGKERRAAAGTEAIRDQIRKVAAGGDNGEQQVSDSEDEDDEDKGAGWSKPPDITDAICQALKKNFVFRGISDTLLHDVVDRMSGMCFKAGSVLLRQGAAPKPDDCMYYLQVGEVDVVISGAVDQSAKTNGEEERQVVGHTVRIPQKPGWVFGDIALLFNSSRTASVVAKTNIIIWALDRRTFLQFVMKHAQGARALRFLRKLPLLKGLSDNDLITAASRMPQRTYQDGAALIKVGERGDELYLIRYGKVRVMRPDGKGGQIEAVVLGRGQFVGERAVINNKLRSADCVAKGMVKVVVMKKKDFMDLDNPLLAWMMDYDAVSTCLRFVPYVRGVKQEQMEGILDRFDARQEFREGTEIVAQGDLVEKLCVIKLGEVRLIQDGQQVQDPDFVHEAGGFSFFGEAALQQPFKSPYSVIVATDNLHMLTLVKAQLDSFLGLSSGLSSEESIIAALKKCKALKGLAESDLKQLLASATEQTYNAGDVVVEASAGPCGSVFLVRSGEALQVAPDVALPGQVDLGGLVVVERGRLPPGSLFNEEAANGTGLAGLKASLVASAPGTTVMAISRDDILGFKSINMFRMQEGRSQRLTNVRFADLELHRIIGTGQFGLVRLVRNTKGNDVYALKVMHKSPITESKEMEHVINERKILEEATHPFCVQLKGAYQDRLCLYLLQEWVPGGELFHHLDLQGAFDEPTSVFFAANVLLSLEFLHSKGIVYRDLKPENLLLDAQGYLKMADFGFAKHVGRDSTYTICGTPDYQAPEVIMRRGTTKAADYWALGVLIYEMLVGDPPFKSDSPADTWDTFRKVLSGRFQMPPFISAHAQDMIAVLLKLDPSSRLGCELDNPADAIKQHAFFREIDWAKLERRELIAPIQPRIVNPLDTSNFDNFDSCDVDPPALKPGVAERQPNWDLWEWIE